MFYVAKLLDNGDLRPVYTGGKGDCGWYMWNRTPYPLEPYILIKVRKGVMLNVNNRRDDQ